MDRQRSSQPQRVVAAPDKFRGTATASQVVDAIEVAALARGWEIDKKPLADGGEGLLEVLGGANRRTMVTGPLGDPITASWRLTGSLAIIEMAKASGLELVGGKDGNDPLSASTAGTGELVAEAAYAGAKRIVVGVGGSATTDGGLGAIRAMEPLSRFGRVELEVACDVRLGFVEAATRFGPQKGASAAQVRLLERRLMRLAQVYEEQFSIDVSGLQFAGAAGGLAGGLAAIGATLRPGFDLVAEEVELADAMSNADLVVTGEGLLDDQSMDGKVVGGVVSMAAELGVPVLVIVGGVGEGRHAPPGLDGVDVVSLSATFGTAEAMARPCALVTEVVGNAMSGM